MNYHNEESTSVDYIPQNTQQIPLPKRNVGMVNNVQNIANPNGIQINNLKDIQLQF